MAFPRYTAVVSLSTGDVTYDEGQFYDFKIVDKLNQIPQVTMTFVQASKEAFDKRPIRVYLGDVKIFTGQIIQTKTDYLSPTLYIEARGLVEHLHNAVIKDKTDFKATQSSTIITTKLGYSLDGKSWTYSLVGDNLLDLIIDYRMETGNYLMHIANLAVLNRWDWWVTEDASKNVTVNLGRRKQSPATLPAFDVNTNAFNTDVSLNTDKIKNSITTTGSSSKSSNQKSVIMGIYDLGDGETEAQDYGWVNCNESQLAQAMTAAATEAYLLDVTDYQTVTTRTIQIGDEKITYTGVDLVNKKLTGLTRGANSTTAAVHSPGDDVLMISYFACSPPPRFNTTAMWVGTELMTFSSFTSLNLVDVARGVNGTPKYAHKKGAVCYSGANNLTTPHPESSVGMYGIHEQRATMVGAQDIDTLDKYGFALLQALQENTRFGSFQVIASGLQGLQPGDYFTLKLYGSTETETHRCTGIEYSQGIVTIYFGLNEEWILQQFDDIGKVQDQAYCKEDKVSSYTVLEKATDGKSVKIQHSDGTYEWVAVR